jgi:membrane-bound serine protease (ClpP class)
MNKKIYTFLFILLYNVIFCSFGRENKAAVSGNSKKIIYSISINREIDPIAWRIIKHGLDEAESKHANYIIITLNTYGGLLDYADSIRTRLLRTNAVVIIFVNKNAASAGALISLAGDSIYMTKDATIGAATVVNQDGTPLPDKYQSYMRGMMRSTAEVKGRDSAIAEAMVGSLRTIPGIIDSGRVLTFTTKEAIAHKFCQGEADNFEEVIQKLHIKNYTLISYESTWRDAVIDFLMNPIISSILMLLIFGGIYFEFQHPGIGFPLFAAIGAAVLYFMPLYLDGLAQYWEILMFLVGVVLLILEIFVLPTFGVLGIIGIVFTVAGLTLSLLRINNFDFSFAGWGVAITAFLRVMLVMGIVLTFALVYGDKFFFSGAMKKFVLHTTQDASQGYTTKPNELLNFVGKTGIANTMLRPAGSVKIEDNVYDALTDGDFIEKGEGIKVHALRGNYLVVRKIS